MKRIPILVLVLTVLATGAAAADFQAEHTYLRIYTQNKYDRDVIANLGFAIDYVSLEEGFVEAWVPNRLLAKIERYGFLTQVMESKDTMPANYEAYHDYAEQVAELEALNAQYPDITDLYSIGQSIEGRELWCLKISDNPLTDEVAEPAFAVVAMHHSREILTPEVALYIAAQLVEGYGKDELITYFVNEREVFVIPNLNPDGGEFDHEGGYFHWWRKNRRVNSGSSCMGVDLNRNYGGPNWGGVGSSSWACDETYHGATAFSEPETAAFRDFVADHANINTMLSLHTHARLVLYPWGYTFDHIPDQIDFQTHKRLAEYMAVVTGYTPTQASGLYRTTGDTMDWGYGEMGITTFTFELTPSQLNVMGFYPDDSVIAPTCADVWQAVQMLIGFANEPSLVLATDLWKFTAEVINENDVRIVWRSMLENDPQGWLLRRSPEGQNDYQAVHQGLLPAGQDPYSFRDEGLEPGTYQYLLRYEGTGQNDVDFGPLTVTVGGAVDDDDDDVTPTDDDAADDDVADDDDDAAADADDDDDDEGGCGC